MKPKSIGFPQRYAIALEKQLKQGPAASLEPALQLGRDAVALKLGTLELSRIHEQSLAVMGFSNVKNAFAKLAGIFFTEANSLIEATRGPAREIRDQLNRMMVTLNERTKQLAAANRQLQKSILRRKSMQDDFAERGRQHQQCLGQSLALQKRLRQLTHQVLATQENERKQISRELQDEIAQTLLGINVRLLTLKQEARGSSKGFKKQITSTQKLVARSARSVQRVGRKISGL